MICQNIAQQLDDFLSGNLPAEQLQLWQAHVTTCAECKTNLVVHKKYLNAMASFDSKYLAPELKPELSPEKAMRMLGIASGRIKVVDDEQNNIQLKNTKTNAQGSFLKGFIAASVLFVGLTSFWQFQQSPNPITPNVVAVNPEAFSTEITLLINVPEDMLDADLQIRIPEHVDIEGYEGEDMINWYVDLKKGANSLSLPIKVSADTDLNEVLKFVAEIEYQNKYKEFELEVNLTKKANQANSTSQPVPNAYQQV